MPNSKDMLESELSTSNNDMIIDEYSMEFNRSNIELLNKVIKHVDKDEQTGLDLFCYIHCEPSDSDIRKKCRGVVFDNNKLVMKGFPYTIEYTKINNQQEINDNIVSIFNECSFYDAYEGSLIRMFHYNDKWFLSTNRKFDAFKSKWASKESFGSFFKKALENEYKNNVKFRSTFDFNPEVDDIIERFQSVLDKKKQYMFLLLNSPENRIVSSAYENPTFFHVGTFIDMELDMSDDLSIPYPKEHKFSDINDLYDYVEMMDYKKHQGIIVFAPGNLQYKIFNQDYYELYKVRGNEPSIKFRYLQVRMNKKYSDMLHFLYPEYQEAFAEYENYIYTIATDIMNSYIERFIKKNYVTVPVEEFQVVRDCHGWHLSNRFENKINIDKVIEILNQQPATNINRMIRKRIAEKNNPTLVIVDKPRFKEYTSLLTNKKVLVKITG